MLNWKQYKLLNESFGAIPLGIKSPSNLGLVSKHHTGSEENSIEEMGMTHKIQMPMHMDDDESGPKPPFGGGHDDSDMGGDDSDMGQDDMGDDDGSGEDAGEQMPCPDCNPEGDGEGDPDCETCGGTGEVPNEDGDGEDGDDSIDPDAEFDDEGGMDSDGGEGDDDDDMMMGKKKPPMGNPHDNNPFMQFQKRMQAEACGDKDSGGDLEKGDKLAFMQKKTMKKKMAAGDTAAKPTKIGKVGQGEGKAAPKGNPGVAKGTPPNQKFEMGKFTKKCASGTDHEDKACGKCSKQKKNMKETTQENQYSRPKDFDPSEEAFIESMRKMYGNPSEKFSDGLLSFKKELLPKSEPQPGDVGFAPQTRIGSGDANAIGESITHLMKKIAELENQLKSK